MEGYANFCRVSGQLFGGFVSDKEEAKLADAVRFLRIEVNANEVRSSALAAALFYGITSIGLLALLSFLLGFSAFFLLFLFPIPLLYFYLLRYPVLKEKSVKKDALRYLPNSFFYLVIALRVSPNLERAVRFAGEHSQGLIKSRLDEIIRDVNLGKTSAEKALEGLGSEWEGSCEEFSAALRLLLSSNYEKDEEKRQETLDQASSMLLGGLNQRAQKAARGLQSPVMMIFTFGVILPLVFVALVPFLSLMGVSIGIEFIGLMYLVALPLFLYVLINFVVSSRPVTLPAPKVENSSSLIPLIAGVCAGLPPLLAMRLDLGMVSYLPLLWAIALAASGYLLGSSWKAYREGKQVKSMERDFVGRLHSLSIRLSEGRSIEDALSRVKYRAFQEAMKNVKFRTCSLRNAFFSPDFGSLKSVKSETVKGLMDIIISLADKGPEAVAVVTSKMSSQLRELYETDNEIEKLLGSLVSSMKVICMVVAPMVGGMIASMSLVVAKTVERSSSSGVGFSNGAAIDPTLLTLILGAYVMISTFILGSFSVGLLHGKDNVARNFNLGMSLPISIMVFTLCAWGASQVFAGMV